MTSFFHLGHEFYLTPVGESLAPSTGHPPADGDARTSPAPSSSAPGGGE